MPATSDAICEAEKARDRVVHGKAFTDSELRTAIADVLSYAEAFDSEVHSIASFHPLGDM